jgi:hypothetical protein
MSTPARPNARAKARYRRQLAARDGMRCFYCRTGFRQLAEATIDHIVPTYFGGTWARANLVLACDPCNQAKSNQVPTVFLRSRGYRPGLRPRTGLAFDRSDRLLSLTIPLPARWRTPVPSDHRTGVRSRPAGVRRLALAACLFAAVGWLTRPR